MDQTNEITKLFERYLHPDLFKFYLTNVINQQLDIHALKIIMIDYWTKYGKRTYFHKKHWIYAPWLIDRIKFNDTFIDFLITTNNDKVWAQWIGTDDVQVFKTFIHTSLPPLKLKKHEIINDDELMLRVFHHLQ